MGRPRYTRQLLLFLIAVLLPAGVLIGLGAYVIRQDAELTARRAADEREDAVERATRELTARLGEIRLRETSRWVPSWSAVESADAAVLYAAPVTSASAVVVTPSAGGARAQQRLTPEQVAALTRDLPALKSRLEEAAALAPDGRAWLAYGAEPWLVAFTAPASPSLPQLVVVVSSRAIAPPGTVLVAGATPTSTPLGPPFLDLHIEVQPSAYGATLSASAPLMIAGLVLMLAIVLFAGYLLVRDVGREIGTAELRTLFVADVSHEIKTPLTVIRLYADKLAAAGAADERARAYVATIVNESDRLSRLVDNVLEFARIEAGTKTYRLEPGAVEPVVQSALRTVDYLMAQKGFRVRVTIAPGLPLVWLDADALEQALLNLLTNAAKYSGDARDLEIDVRATSATVSISVADRGIGIDPREHARIFEKFYRARAQAAGHVAGAGLGLALVRHVVEGHGGRVEVASAPGRGSTFTIHLPIVGESAGAGAA